MLVTFSIKTSMQRMDSIYLLVSVLASMGCSTRGDNLEVVQCEGKESTGTITEQFLNIKASPIIKAERLRSNGECAVTCFNNDECFGSAYQSMTGQCFLMSSIPSYSDNPPLTKFTVTNFEGALAKQRVKICAKVDCHENTTCLISCESGSMRPVCTHTAEDVCDIEEEYFNIHHYFSPIYEDNRDEGVLQAVTYPKLRDDSLIRIIWHGSVQAHKNKGHECGRWYFTFNDKECQNPGAIEFMEYAENAIDMHREGNIDGSCANLSKGDVVVELRLGQCDSAYGVDDCETGNRATRQFTIMEIKPRPSDAVKDCPGFAAFNFQQLVWNEVITDPSFGYVVKDFDYNKLADDTALRIKYNANLRMRITTTNPTFHCTRWLITIDGADCSPKGDIELYLQDNCDQAFSNQHRHYTLEAICEGIPAKSDVKIAIKVDSCLNPLSGTSTSPLIYIGWHSSSRLIVEEVRLNAPIEAAYHSSLGKYVKNPFFNIQRKHWDHLDSNKDSGLILQFNYTKFSNYSALRLTSSGSHRIFPSADKLWSRWYFKIDNLECQHPGSIESVSNLNIFANFYHPLQVSGMCYNILAGVRLISYNVGAPTGLVDYADAHTGYHTSFHIIVEEVILEHTKTCSQSQPMDCN